MVCSTWHTIPGGAHGTRVEKAWSVAIALSDIELSIGCVDVHHRVDCKAINKFRIRNAHPPLTVRWIQKNTLHFNAGA